MSDKVRTFRLPAELDDELREVSKLRLSTVDETIREAVRRFLEGAPRYERLTSMNLKTITCGGTNQELNEAIFDLQKDGYMIVSQERYMDSAANEYKYKITAKHKDAVNRPGMTLVD